MKKQYLVLIAGVVLILAFVLGGYLYKGKQAEKIAFLVGENASMFVRDYSPTYGSDDAKVYLVEFMDPACETCSAFHPYVKDFLAAHPGRIKLVIRYAPFHENSDYFVKILEAARKQGKYWKTLEVMFQSQSYWASHHNPRPELVWSFLPLAGLDSKKIAKDMHDPEIVRRIEQDLADARMLNVRKTPEFFVNGKPLPSFGYEQLKTLIEAEIKANY